MKQPFFLFLVFVFGLAVSSCSKKEMTVYDAIPRQTELFLESSDPFGFLGEVSGKAYLEPFLQSTPMLGHLRDWAVRMDTLLQTNGKTRSMLAASQMAFAVVPQGEKCEALLLVSLPTAMKNSEMKRFFKTVGIPCDERKSREMDYLVVSDLDTLLLFTEGSVVGVCKDLAMVEQVHAQCHSSEKIHSLEEVKRLQKTLGHHVKAHLYFKDKRGWSVLDVLPEATDLVMNGYSMATDSLSSLRPLKYQLPVKNSIVNILPFDTRLMLHFGMSDYASYWQSFRDRERVAAFDKSHATDVERQLLEHLSEVSFNVICDDRHEVFVGRMNDPSAVIKFMDRLATKTGIASSQNCQGYVLYDLGKTDFVPTVFGPEFNSIKRCCYSIVDQYLVMASGFAPLQEMISCYRSGRTLDLNENFRTFQLKMLESCNVTLFATGKGNQERVSKTLDGLMQRYLNQHEKLLDNFQAVSLQLASSKDLVYTNICLHQGSAPKNENIVQWKANLDAPLKGQPFIVQNPKSTDNQVIAFDRQNTMYLLDSKGEVAWKKTLEESPLSEVFTVDFYNNGLIQFLFNTAHTIQLIDCDGENVAGYPLRLPFEASNGLAVLDYNGKKDYRILLCGTDRLVYNYTTQGVEVEGWNHHRAEDLVRRPVQHIVADDKDFLIVSDVSGGVRILDRQGRIRIPLASDMQKSQKADIYANVTNRGKGLFLTTDKEGKLLYVAADGSLTRTDFGTYSPEHFFLYEDFNGDGDPDFIYLDHGELRIFDRFKKELFASHFDVEIQAKPVFFNITRSKRLLGIVSEKAREIYLIDRKGKMIVNSGLVGETPFAVGSLHNDQEINLITGVGNALYNYSIY